MSEPYCLYCQGLNFTTAIAVGALFGVIWSFALVPSGLSFFISLYQRKSCLAPQNMKREACIAHFFFDLGQTELFLRG
jgi:hypothetical protein